MSHILFSVFSKRPIRCSISKSLKFQMFFDVCKECFSSNENWERSGSVVECLTLDRGTAV